MARAGRPAAVVLVLVGLSSVGGRAQGPLAQVPAPSAPTQGPAASADVYQRIPLTVGRSTVLATSFDVTRLAVTNPAVADATVVAPREVLIDGKGPGTVSLIVWGGSGRTQYDVVVEPGVSVLQQQLNLLFPGEDIQVGM